MSCLWANFIGYHYDIARGAYLKPAVFKAALERAAKAGFTHFIPYLENMIRLPSSQKACPSCAYTKEQWKEFEQVASQCQIALIPHFNVIGHTEHFCPVYPELSGAKNEREMDVTLPEARDWTLQSLEEFCDISSSRYFLIGGDEWQPTEQFLRQSSMTPAQAWVEHMNVCVDFLAGKGRTPVIWHDLLFHYPD